MADNDRKQSPTASSRILNRSGGPKGDNDLRSSSSDSGAVRSQDSAPSGGQSSTNPTTNPPALVDTPASILRNALTISAGLVVDEHPFPRAALADVDRLMRQALQLIERAAAPPIAAPGQIPLYRPEPVTPPAEYLAEQLREMNRTNRELAGDPFALLEDEPPAGSGA